MFGKPKNQERNPLRNDVHLSASEVRSPRVEHFGDVRRATSALPAHRTVSNQMKLGLSREQVSLMTSADRPSWGQMLTARCLLFASER